MPARMNSCDTIAVSQRLTINQYAVAIEDDHGPPDASAGKFGHRLTHWQTNQSARIGMELGTRNDRRTRRASCAHDQIE